MKITRAFALVAMAALLAVACSVKSSIVGKWQEIGGEERMEFLESRTISLVSGGIAFSGKYSFIDGSHLKVEFEGIASLAGPQILTVALDGNTLTLTDAKGKVTQYWRTIEGR